MNSAYNVARFAETAGAIV